MATIMIGMVGTSRVVARGNRHLVGGSVQPDHKWAAVLDSEISQVPLDTAEATSVAPKACSSLGEWSDDQLLARIVGADADAFEILYDRYSRLAFSLAYHLLADAGAAEEIVQEAFLSLWRQSHAYSQERGAVRAWLLSIVHHRAIDRLRSRRRHEDRQEWLDEAALPSAPTNTWQEAQNSIDAKEIHNALAKLPPDQRRSILLAYFGGLSHEEIAHILNVPLGTVKGRLRLGLQKMRHILIARGVGG